MTSNSSNMRLFKLRLKLGKTAKPVVKPCVRCKQIKRKCNGERPCSRCKEMGYTKECLESACFVEGHNGLLPYLMSNPQYSPQSSTRLDFEPQAEMAGIVSTMRKLPHAMMFQFTMFGHNPDFLNQVIQVLPPAFRLTAFEILDACQRRPRPNIAGEMKVRLGLSEKMDESATGDIQMLVDPVTFCRQSYQCNYQYAAQMMGAHVEELLAAMAQRDVGIPTTELRMVCLCFELLHAIYVRGEPVYESYDCRRKNYRGNKFQGFHLIHRRMSVLRCEDGILFSTNCKPVAPEEYDLAQALKPECCEMFVSEIGGARSGWDMVNDPMFERKESLDFLLQTEEGMAMLERLRLLLIRKFMPILGYAITKDQVATDSMDSINSTTSSVSPITPVASLSSVSSVRTVAMPPAKHAAADNVHWPGSTPSPISRPTSYSDSLGSHCSTVTHDPAPGFLSRTPEFFVNNTLMSLACTLNNHPFEIRLKQSMVNKMVGNTIQNHDHQQQQDFSQLKVQKGPVIVAGGLLPSIRDMLQYHS